MQKVQRRSRWFVPVSFSRTQVAQLGMSERVGNISYQMPEPGQLVVDKPYSEQTAQMIDDEVRILIRSCYDRTHELLAKHKNNVEKVKTSLSNYFDHGFIGILLWYKNCVTFSKRSYTRQKKKIGFWAIWQTKWYQMTIFGPLTMT